jgi:CHAT domain-containing protein
LLVCIVAQCGCRKTQGPETAYANIQQEIRQGNLDSALDDLDRASKEYGTKSEEWDWKFRVLKAQDFVYRKEYKKALALLQQEIPPQLASHEVAVRKNMVEGIAYRYAQQFDKSADKFGMAESLAASFHPKFLSAVLNSRGALEIDENNYEKANTILLRALSLSRADKDSIQEADALGNLGLVATKQGHFDEAIDWNQAALNLSRSLGLNANVAIILGNMGWSYFQLGDFQNAMPLYKEAAKESEQRKLFAYQAYWLTTVADSQYALRDFKAAEDTLQKALALSRGLDEKSALASSLNDLAAVALETGRVELAQQYNKEALGIERAGLDQSGVSVSQLISARIEASQRNLAGAEKLLQEIIADKKSEPPIKWESQARLAKIYDDEGKQVPAEREYIQAISTIEAARNALPPGEFRLTFLSSSIEFYEDYVDFLVAHGRSGDALKVAELSRARTLAEGLSSTAEAVRLTAVAVRPQQVAQWVGQTLLFYWIGQKQSHLWVITPTKTAYFKMPKASEIQPLVKSYRSALRDLHDVRDTGSEAAKQLYAMLVEPAKKLIPQGSRVILLPDPSLSALNFETLIVTGSQPHFWIEDVTLTSASSLTLLASSAGRPATKDKSLLLVGNTETVQPFDPLPQAADEMKRVERYFPAAKREVLEGKQATPSAYLNSNPERFAYLHFVTHGTASVTRPLESAVILSKEGDSYKLYARDIVKHPLTAQLVTISACEGAGKTAYSGEGLIGLSWAFLRAGAHNVIGALWEVNDSAAPELMDAFYSALSHGQDTASALRTAKLSLLHSKDSQNVFRKPYYWAAFQLYAGS